MKLNALDHNYDRCIKYFSRIHQDNFHHFNKSIRGQHREFYNTTSLNFKMYKGRPLKNQH